MQGAMTGAAYSGTTEAAGSKRMRSSRWRNALRSPEVSSFAILAVIVVLFNVGNHDFLSARNISNILAFLPELGIIALGMTLLMTAGEFDLGVGAVFAFGPVTVMLLVQQWGWEFWPALLVGLAACIVIGLFNGIVITKIGISSFLVTLSMLLIVRGAALYITQGFPLKSVDLQGPLVTLLAGSFAIGPFTIYASLFWFVGLIPDLATLRDRATSRFPRFMYGLLSMGWRNSAMHWHRYETASLLLAGVTDFSAHHFDSAQRSDPAAALIGAAAGERPKILLAHQPSSADAAAAAGYDVQISGHTHGGQFWPWNLLVGYFQPFTAGLNRLHNLMVYVSRGTGYWGPPNRFVVPGEITRIRLVPV